MILWAYSPTADPECHARASQDAKQTEPPRAAMPPSKDDLRRLGADIKKKRKEVATLTHQYRKMQKEVHDNMPEKEKAAMWRGRMQALRNNESRSSDEDDIDDDSDDYRPDQTTADLRTNRYTSEEDRQFLYDVCKLRSKHGKAGY